MLLRCSIYLLLHSWLAKWLQQQNWPHWAAEADQKQQLLGALEQGGLVLIDSRLVLKVRKGKINFVGLLGYLF